MILSNNFDGSEINYTQETLDAIKEMLVSLGANHGTGDMSVLAQLSAGNIYSQIGELIDKVAESTAPAP